MFYDDKLIMAINHSVGTVIKNTYTLGSHHGYTSPNERIKEERQEDEEQIDKLKVPDFPSELTFEEN